VLNKREKINADIAISVLGILTWLTVIRAGVDQRWCGFKEL